MLRFSGFMFPTARPTEVRRAVREFLTTPIDWYMHLALHASRHGRVSLSGVSVPAVFVAGTYDVLADTRTCAPRPTASTGRRTGCWHALPAARASGDRGQMLRDLVEAVGD